MHVRLAGANELEFVSFCRVFGLMEHDGVFPGQRPQRGRSAHTFAKTNDFNVVCITGKSAAGVGVAPPSLARFR